LFTDKYRCTAQSFNRRLSTCQSCQSVTAHMGKINDLEPRGTRKERRLSVAVSCFKAIVLLCPCTGTRKSSVVANATLPSLDMNNLKQLPRNLTLPRRMSIRTLFTFCTLVVVHLEFSRISPTLHLSHPVLYDEWRRRCGGATLTTRQFSRHNFPGLVANFGFPVTLSWSSTCD
jgi:hypothetical protein